MCRCLCAGAGAGACACAVLLIASLETPQSRETRQIGNAQHCEGEPWSMNLSSSSGSVKVLSQICRKTVSLR